VNSGSNPSKKAVLLSSQFLHNELPIRMAKRVLQIEQMPHGFPTMPSILDLKDRITESFQDLVNFPVMNLRSFDMSQKIVYSLGATESSKMFRKSDLMSLSNDLSEILDAQGQRNYQTITGNFMAVLEDIKRRHEQGKNGITSLGPSGGPCLAPNSPVSSLGTPPPPFSSDMSLLGQGLRELRSSLSEEERRTIKLNEFLDPFNRARIGIRLLIGQHLTLVRGSPPGHIGLVAPKCNIYQVIKTAADAAR